jgi:hypothetical protein
MRCGPPPETRREAQIFLLKWFLRTATSLSSTNRAGSCPPRRGTRWPWQTRCSPLRHACRHRGEKNGPALFTGWTGHLRPHPCAKKTSSPVLQKLSDRSLSACMRPWYGGLREDTGTEDAPSANPADRKRMRVFPPAGRVSEARTAVTPGRCCRYNGWTQSAET